MNLSNKTKKKTDLSVTIILVLGIFLSINFISYLIHFFRLDLTENKIYSISDVSKKTVENLNDVVTVNAYFSENLPSQMISLRQEIEDFLDEYQVFSKGNLSVEFIDPKDDEELKRELYMMGIPELTFQVYEKDKRQAVNGYMGIAIKYSGNTEVIPVVKQDTKDLEYQITTAIKKVSRDEDLIVGVLSTQGASDTENEISQAYKSIKELYNVQLVALDDDDAVISNSINTLLIIGAKDEFSDEQFKSINAFLARGGSLVVFDNRINVSNSLEVSSNKSNISSLLSLYGINIKNNLVADTRSGLVPISNGFFTIPTQYYFWPKIEEDGFNQNYSAVSSLSSLIFPWSSSVSIDEAKISADSFSYLLTTTNKAWAVEGNFDVGLQSKPTGTQQKFNLAAVVNSGLKDAFNGEAISGRIAVVGDSDFISDNFIQNSPDNLTFFQNIVDNLTLDDDLINIRSKVVTSRPIDDTLTDGKRLMIRYFNIFGVTVLVILFGMTRYYLRRKSKFVDEV